MKQQIGKILYNQRRVLPEIITSVLHSPRYLSLIRGTYVTSVSGEKIHFKVKSVQAVKFDEGLSFSKYTIVTTINADGIEEKGWGSSDFRLLALEKSMSEALERLIFRLVKNKGEGTQTSNGWACHLNGEVAARNSFEELAERDGILFHWLTQRPLTEIEVKTSPNFIQHWISNNLRLNSFLKNLRILVADGGYLPIAVVILQADSGASVVAHSVGKSLRGAVVRALNEACLLAGNLKANMYFESSKNLLLKGPISDGAKPQDHNVLYAYHDRLPDFLFGSIIEWNSAENNWATNFAASLCKKIDFKFHEIVSAPFVVGYGESKDFQNLYFGSTTSAIAKGNINFSRLNLETGEEINLRPHFIG